MKVLLIAYALDDSAGSEPGNGWQWLTNLAKEVESVTAITTLKNKNLLVGKLRAEKMNNIELVGIPEVGSEYLKKTPTLLFYFQYAIWQKSVKRYLLTENIQFDIAHQATMGTFVFGSCLSDLNRPFVLGPAGSTLIRRYDLKYLGLSAKIIESCRNIFLVMNFRVNFSARKALKNSSKLLVANTDTFSIINGKSYEHKIILEPQEGAKKYKYIPQSSIKDNPYHILWVGRFLPRKNPMFAVNVIQELKSLDSRFYLEFVGHGIMLKSLKREIQKRSLEDSVIFSEWISNEELKAKYESAGVLIFTSVRDSGGAQLLEALTSGLPVVSLDATGAAKWLKTRGIHFVSSRFYESAIQEMTKEVLKISTLEGKVRSEFRAAIRKDVLRNWSWAKKTQRVLKIYQEINQQRQTIY